MTDMTLYTSYGPSSMSANEAGILLTVILGIIGIFFVFAIVLYLFNAFGMYKLAENYNKTNETKIEYTWMAWIPMVSNYFLGVLLLELSKNNEKVKTKPNENLPLIFLTISFVSGILAATEELAIIGSIASIGLSIYASYLLASRYSKEPIIGTILGTLFFPFYIFALRNRPLEEKAQQIKEEMQKQEVNETKEH